MNVEVLVIGAGVGGLTAAAALARAGREVGIVEIAPQIGGSAALSEGYVWTNPSDSSFIRQDPGGDLDKFRAMRAEFRSAITDIRSHGIDVGPDLTEVLGYGEGNQVEIGGYLLNCRRTVEAAGGWLLLVHDVVQLTTTDGCVTGARVRDVATGEVFDLATRTVVLATGGFQGSADLRAAYIGEWTRDILLRANPHSAGRGLELGLAAGAGLSDGLEAFYGHLIPTLISRWEPGLFTPLSQYYSEHGVLLDHAGQRFVDESLGDHVLVQEVAKRGTALLFVDRWVWESFARAAFIPGMDSQDKIEEARAAGARVSVADSLEELTTPVDEWGFDADAVLASLRSVHADRTGPDGTPLDAPPYALLEVQPAITFTHGGLRTDVEGHVLRDDGSPIRGLRAAGVDAGGLNVQGYSGGLVRGITLGRIAARSIENELATRPPLRSEEPQPRP